MPVKIQRGAGQGMTQALGDGQDIRIAVDEDAGHGVPLRYNYDKPEESRNIKGFQGFKPDF